MARCSAFLFALLLATLAFSQVYAAVTAMESLMLYYDCDGLPPADQSPYRRYNATTVGSPTLVPGKVGNAIRLNPNGAMTDAFYAGQWQLSDPVSVTAWFQIDANTSGDYMKIVSVKQTSSDPDGIEVQYQGSQFTLLGSGSSNFATSTALTIQPNTWYHVACVANGATGTIYLKWSQCHWQFGIESHPRQSRQRCHCRSVSNRHFSQRRRCVAWRIGRSANL